VVPRNIDLCGKDGVFQSTKGFVGGGEKLPKTIYDRKSGLARDIVSCGKLKYLYREIEVQVEERKYRTSKQPYKVVGW